MSLKVLPKEGNWSHFGHVTESTLSSPIACSGDVSLEDNCLLRSQGFYGFVHLSPFIPDDHPKSAFSQLLAAAESK